MPLSASKEAGTDTHWLYVGEWFEDWDPYPHMQPVPAPSNAAEVRMHQECLRDIGNTLSGDLQVRTVRPVDDPPMFLEPSAINGLALLEKGFLSPRAGGNPDFYFINNTSDLFMV